MIETFLILGMLVTLASLTLFVLVELETKRRNK